MIFRRYTSRYGRQLLGRAVVVLILAVGASVGCSVGESDDREPAVTSSPPTARTSTDDNPVPTTQAASDEEESGSDDPRSEPDQQAPLIDAEETAASLPEQPTRPPSPNGLVAPLVATDPEALAADIAAAEQVLRDPQATSEELAVWGHVHQVSVRKLAREPEWTWSVLAALPDSIRPSTTRHLEARQAITGLHSGFDRADIVPAWEIIAPEPPAALLSHYLEAEANTGIDWEYLAAINFMETGFGRIDGLSSAGAQGPMQFIPTTWDEVGEGDVHNPRDAIAAAARYLVRRGGPEDMDQALWGYNNSDSYVAAVQAYAQLLRDDPAAFTGMWNHRIYFTTSAGEIWLPEGYRQEDALPVEEYLESAPWSLPDPDLLAASGDD